MSDAARPPADITCPHCGYNLFGITSDRCPECGQPFDPTDTASRLPWSHRNERGRVKAYMATVRLVIRQPRKLQDEMARPVSYRDARLFWIINSAVLSVSTLMLAGAGFAAAATGHGVRDVRNGNLMSTPLARGIVWDLLAPAVSGWMFTPLMAILVIAATFTCTATLPFLMNRRAFPMPRRARAVCLAYYVSATLLTWPLLTVVAGLLALIVFLRDANSSTGLDDALLVLIIGSQVAIAIALVLTVLRAASIYQRTCHGGIGRWMAGIVLLPLAWLAALGFWLAAVPWAIGASWLLWRGLR